jgi:protein TonB
MPRLLFTLLFAAQCTAAIGQSFEPCVPYGGQPAVDRLFKQELRYPANETAEGNVLVIFNVLADGSVQDLRIWRPLSPACDAEALRVARMIRWHPALMDGEKVAAEHFIPVPFDRKRIARWSTDRRTLPDTLSALPADTSLVLHNPVTVDRPIAPAIAGGWAALTEDLARRLQYPPDALKRDIDGPVLVEFVVEPSGTLSNMRAVQELGAGCNEEAFRLIEDLTWLPAVHQGRRVRSTTHVRLRFRLPR